MPVVLKILIRAADPNLLVHHYLRYMRVYIVHLFTHLLDPLSLWSVMQTPHPTHLYFWYPALLLGLCGHSAHAYKKRCQETKEKGEKSHQTFSGRFAGHCSYNNSKWICSSFSWVMPEKSALEVGSSLPGGTELHLSTRPSLETPWSSWLTCHQPKGPGWRVRSHHN